MSIGVTELIIILLIGAALFGAKKIPEMGKTLGSAVREFKDATGDIKDSVSEITEPLEEVKDAVKTVEDIKDKTKKIV